MKNYTVKIWNRYSFTKPENCKLVLTTNYDATDENHAIKQAIKDSHRWNKDYPNNKEQTANSVTCNGHYANI